MRAGLSRSILVGCTAVAGLPFPATAAEALFRVDAGRIVIAPPPGTPVLPFEIRYPADPPWPGDAPVREQIAERSFPEVVTIRSIDPARRIVRVVTTYRAANALNQRDATVTRVGPDKADPLCSSVFAPFRLSAAAPPETLRPSATSGARCPDAAEVNPERQLIVEGLDRRARRLFAAVSDDPRWSISESIDPSGGLQLVSRGRKPAVSTYVMFRAPIDARLARLRIWQIDVPGGTRAGARAIGDIEWINVETGK